MAILKFRTPPAVLASLVMFLGLFFGLSAAGAEVATGTNSFLAYYQRLYEDALVAWTKNSNSATIGWELGRACYDRADFATNNVERAAFAEQGMAACRRAIEQESNSAAAHYFLALNTGQLARTRLFTALYLVDHLEKAMKDSIGLDAKYDFAGGHRALGVLYRDAPGWPVSLGSRAKSRRHLDRAVELFPDFPGNQIHRMDSWIKWGEKARAVRSIPVAEEILKAARTNLTGQAWAASWAEWDREWMSITTRVASARRPAGDR